MCSFVIPKRMPNACWKRCHPSATNMLSITKLSIWTIQVKKLLCLNQSEVLQRIMFPFEKQYSCSYLRWSFLLLNQSKTISFNRSFRNLDLIYVSRVFCVSCVRFVFIWGAKHFLTDLCTVVLCFIVTSLSHTLWMFRHQEACLIQPHLK